MASVAEILEALIPDRARRIAMFESYARGRQYRGRPSWWCDDVPVHDRAPCIVEPVVDGAIRSYRALLLGVDQFPQINHPESEEADAAAALVAKASKFARAARRALSVALAAGSSATLIGAERGELKLWQLPVKWCYPHYDESGLERVEFCMPRVETVVDPRSGTSLQRVVLHRRTIDRDRDITYLPATIERADVVPAPVEDKARTIKHGLGLCPVVWYRHQADDTDDDEDASDVDGHPIHEQLLDEIDGLNRSHSQHHRAAQYVGDPQIVETGVDLDHNPAPTGPAARRGRSYANESPRSKAAAESWVARGGAVPQGARRKGPSVVWRYPSSDTRVQILTLQEGALGAVDDDRTKLGELVAGGMHWVRLESSSRMSGAQVRAMSGTAMAWMYRSQLLACDDMREEFGDGWILPAMTILLHVALSARARGERVSVDVPRGIPTSGFELNWGPYFKENETDAAQLSDRVRKDLEAGLITLETAVQQIAGTYGIKDTATYTEELRAERAERERDSAETYHAAVEAMAGGEEDEGEEYEEEDGDEEGEESEE